MLHDHVCRPDAGIPVGHQKERRAAFVMSVTKKSYSAPIAGQSVLSANKTTTYLYGTNCGHSIRACVVVLLCHMAHSST